VIPQQRCDCSSFAKTLEFKCESTQPSSPPAGPPTGLPVDYDGCFC
jgi:hypothetical protein